jgi:dATP pyrophosphohydrolase
MEGLEFLLLKRADKVRYPGLWQMISGHCDNNETAVDTVLRELKEETGLTPLKLWVAPNVNSFYAPETDSVSVIPVFAALVKDDAKIILSEEHSEYIWIGTAEAIKLLAWEGQRKSVGLIEEYYLRGKEYLQFTDINLEPLLKKI